MNKSMNTYKAGKGPDRKILNELLILSVVK